MTRLGLAFVTLILIASGLALRLGSWNLPLWIHHRGGGFLWGAMLFTLIATLRPLAWRRRECAMAALAIVVVIEGSRLVQGAALDAFRATLAGQLLLGRIFSPWNFLVDALGIGTIAVLMRDFPGKLDSSALNK